MSNLTPIHRIRREDALDAVKTALRSDLDALDDYLAGVDWSGTTSQRRSEIADLLGQLEGWAAQYGDDALTRSQYVGHLLSLLPEDERERYYVQGGGPVSITVSALQAASLLRLGLARSSPQPRTGSGAHPQARLGDEVESETFLAV